MGRGRVDDEDEDGGSGSKGDNRDNGETAAGLSFCEQGSTDDGTRRCLASDEKRL